MWQSKMLRTLNKLRIVIVALALILAGTLAYANETDRYTTENIKRSDFDLVILHTNDIHAHDLPFKEKGHLIGGVAKIDYLVTSIKKQHNNVLVVDAGDFFQGTPLFQRYGGEVEIEALNEIGYDVVELGNHEFDRGAKYLANQLQAAKFPVLACNLDCRQVPSLEHFVKPGLVKEINGEKIAFIGVITPDLEKKALGLDGVKVKAPDGNWLAPVGEEIKHFQNQGINKIIIVSHCGIELDKRLAEAFPAIDLIIGGHSHTRLTQPVWIMHPDNTYTAIVQTGCHGRALGDIDLKFDKEGNILKSETRYRLINITSNMKEDLTLEHYLEKKEKPLLALRDKIVGFSNDTFWNHFATMPGDSAIGDLICDAIAEAETVHGVQITFQNRGGIRGKIERGPISEEMVQEILPFGNKIVCATVSGGALLAILERSSAGPHYGGFLDVHGLRIGYNSEREPGKRIVYALVQNDTDKWSPIQARESYKIAVNDYTFKGGDGCDFSKATDALYEDTTVAQALSNYLLKHKHVKPQYGHRIIVIDQSQTTSNKPFCRRRQNGSDSTY